MILKKYLKSKELIGGIMRVCYQHVEVWQYIIADYMDNKNIIGVMMESNINEGLA